MEHTSYRLIPFSDRRPRIHDTVEEVRRAAWAMREKNKGYYMYEVTEQDGKRRMTMLGGWNPRV